MTYVCCLLFELWLLLSNNRVDSICYPRCSRISKGASGHVFFIIPLNLLYLFPGDAIASWDCLCTLYELKAFSFVIRKLWQRSMKISSFGSHTSKSYIIVLWYWRTKHGHGMRNFLHFPISKLVIWEFFCPVCYQKPSSSVILQVYLFISCLEYLIHPQKNLIQYPDFIFFCLDWGYSASLPFLTAYIIFR